MSFVDAVHHLPDGAVLVVPHVSWDGYESLLADLEDRPGLRASYDDGTLAVMSPSSEHEDYKELMSALSRVLAKELHLPLETRGSTTWKRRGIGKAAEADTGFYVDNASRIIGRRTIDLDADPPPDVVVEIDVTNESLRKLPAYAALGVPEVWRYDGVHAYLYILRDGSYVQVDGSRTFPTLSPALLTHVLAVGKTQGQAAAIALLRQRVRT